MDNSEKKKILKARAHILAQQSEKGKDNEPSIQIIEFMLENEKYAFETGYLKAVYSLKEITALPCTPAFVSGIINIKGRILSVIDLKVFLGLQSGKSINNNTPGGKKVIIIHKDEMEFGILADSITGIANVLVNDIHPPIPTLSGTGISHFKGISRERLIILDAESILNDKKIIVHEEV